MGNNNSSQTLQVSSFKHVSKTCKNSGMSHSPAGFSALHFGAQLRLGFFCDGTPTCLSCFFLCVCTTFISVGADLAFFVAFIAWSAVLLSLSVLASIGALIGIFRFSMFVLRGLCSSLVLLSVLFVGLLRLRSCRLRLFPARTLRRLAGFLFPVRFLLLVGSFRFGRLFPGFLFDTLHRGRKETIEPRLRCAPSDAARLAGLFQIRSECLLVGRLLFIQELQ